MASCPRRGGLLTIIAAIEDPAVLGNLSVHGAENLDVLEEPVMFMANHCSYLNSPLAVLAIPRRFRSKLSIAAAHDTLYEKFWWMAPFAELAFNTYPLATQLSENIKPSIEYTGRLLDDGWSVLIFPEGQMNRSGTAL